MPAIQLEERIINFRVIGENQISTNEIDFRGSKASPKIRTITSVNGAIVTPTSFVVMDSHSIWLQHQAVCVEGRSTGLDEAHVNRARDLFQIIINSEKGNNDVNGIVSKVKLRKYSGLYLLNNQFAQPYELEQAYLKLERWELFNRDLIKDVPLLNRFSEDYNNALQRNSLKKAKFEISKKNYYNRLEDQINVLESIEERLLIDAEPNPIQTPTPKSINTNISNKVFVVHGHDELAKLSLENYIHSLGLEPIVLHRQHDGGRTVIEKFEQHANDVCYAFILLTPDEVSYLISEDAKDDKDRNKELRARPNVIFELGFFVGALTREKVCCIHTGNVTLPSDLTGLVYKGYKNSIEEIKHELRQELIHAGLKLKD